MEELNNTQQTEVVEETQERTFTEAEVADLLQREGDRRVSEALKKAEKKFDKKMSLSQLDENARALAEKDDVIEELREQIRTASIEKNKAEIIKTLSGRGLPTVFADIISVGEDVTEAQSRIERLSKEFDKAVAKKASEIIGSNATTPQVGNALSGATTKEQFRKMSIRDQQALYDRDPELYKELSRR